MSDENVARLDPAAITLAPGRREPFTLQPLITDMLQTRRCISGSIFIVEGMDVLPISESSGLKAVRLLLGDGELCVQALLHGDLFHLVDSEELHVGCYVRVEDFLIRFEESPDDIHDREMGEGSMVYLIVNELEPIGWNESYVALWRRAQKGKDVERPASENDAVRKKEEADAKYEKAAEETKAHSPKRGYQKAKVEDAKDDDDTDMEDAFETLEALTFPPPRKPAQKPASASTSTSTSTSTTTSSRTEAGGSGSKPPQQQLLPIALPKDWHDPQVPLKLTTLRSIPHLPYAQNWSVNVLAIVASLSPVEPSHLPPGKQRTARIADPSTAKQVHLTVFLDPEGFTPAVGSAVLLTGVKNHRFDGGSLKKYASDGKGKGKGVRWWFEDPWELQWLDVSGIKSWWSEMETYYLEHNTTTTTTTTATSSSTK